MQIFEWLYNHHEYNIDNYTNLKKELPIFMVPTKYYKLDNMPLNKNGKVDRKELKRLYVANL